MEHYVALRKGAHEDDVPGHRTDW